MRKRVRALEYIVRISWNSITDYYKNESDMGLDKVTLEHILVPEVWLFDSFECTKPAGCGSCHRSDQERPFPFVVHFALLLALRDIVGVSYAR